MGCDQNAAGVANTLFAHLLGEKAAHLLVRLTLQNMLKFTQTMFVFFFTVIGVTISLFQSMAFRK